MLDDAIPFLLIALTSFVLLSADVWILGFFDQDVAVYGMASRLVTFVAMPLLVVNLVLPPIVAEMYARGRGAGWSARCAPSVHWPVSRPC